MLLRVQNGGGRTILLHSPSGSVAKGSMAAAVLYNIQDRVNTLHRLRVSNGGGGGKTIQASDCVVRSMLHRVRVSNGGCGGKTILPSDRGAILLQIPEMALFKTYPKPNLTLESEQQTETYHELC